MRGLGGPLLGSGLPRGSRGVVVVVVLRSDRSRSRGRLVVVVVLDWSWLMDWGRSWGGLTRRMLLAERWVVPARIVLSIVIALVVVATATAAELRLVLRFWLVLSLGLVLRLRSRSSGMWWWSWGYWQMVTGSLESAKQKHSTINRTRNILELSIENLPIFASDVGDGSSLSGRVKVAVRTASVTIGIRFLLKVGTILLVVSGAELSVSGKVALLTQDRCRLRVTVVAALGLVLRGRGRDQQR